MSRHRLMYTGTTRAWAAVVTKHGSFQHPTQTIVCVTHALKIPHLSLVPRVPLEVSPAVPGFVTGSRRH